MGFCRNRSQGAISASQAGNNTFAELTTKSKRITSISEIIAFLAFEGENDAIKRISAMKKNVGIKKLKDFAMPIPRLSEILNPNR